MKKKKSAAAKKAPKAEKKDRGIELARDAGKSKHFQDLLSTKRDEILRAVKEKEEGMNSSDVGDEADIASQTFEKEMMFELTDAERLIVDDIEAALRKIEKGEFSLCESCRKKISMERLKAMPWTRYCIDCKMKAEVSA